MNTQELQLGAQFCAAFNRGVALNTADWYNPTAYYTGPIQNEYAGFWHQVSINHKAYGFPYDDVNNQSSGGILPNANPLKQRDAWHRLVTFLHIKDNA
ncbi:MAG TPA: beta-1,3-glucanase family protein [Ktedonobacteraceae bacterium]|nr:beta-1,3-glucanase family protein [Ktedonobacteraceae bacterium]